jgi:hypothetical protein
MVQGLWRDRKKAAKTEKVSKVGEGGNSEDKLPILLKPMKPH